MTFWEWQNNRDSKKKNVWLPEVCGGQKGRSFNGQSTGLF